MGRALIADPYLPQKAEAGRLTEIVPCLSCNRCIQTLRKDAVRCAVNPEAGNEEPFRFSKVDHPRRSGSLAEGPADSRRPRLLPAGGTR